MGDKSASARLKLARAILEDEVTLVESFLTLRHVPLQLLLRRLSYSMQIFLEPLLVYQNKFGGTIEYEAFLESVNKIVEPHKIILSKLRNRIRVRKTLVASGVALDQVGSTSVALGVLRQGFLFWSAESSARVDTQDFSSGSPQQ